jgi:glycosyltransferase involved in cell wall biosynthesis
MHRTRDGRVLAAYVRSLVRSGRDLARLCRDEHVDAVHAFSLIAALYGLVAARWARVPLLVHVQDAQPPRRLRRAALRLLGRCGTRLVCVSRAVEEMLRAIGVPAEKLVLIYNAVDPSFLDGKPASPPELARDGPHVGLFAHIIPWKGHRVFLDAAALLAPRFPSARFHVIGARLAGVPASYVDSLRARAAEPPLAGRVELNGARADVAPWMAGMDVVVHASVAPEAFGLVIAEGMALGKPVVAADSGAPRELVTDGETGYLARPGDPESLARVLAHVLESGDPELGRRAAAASRARFAPEIFGAELQRVYDDVLGNADRRRRFSV